MGRTSTNGASLLAIEYEGNEYGSYESYDVFNVNVCTGGSKEYSSSKYSDEYRAVI